MVESSLPKRMARVRFPDFAFCLALVLISFNARDKLSIKAAVREWGFGKLSGNELLRLIDNFAIGKREWVDFER